MFPSKAAAMGIYLGDYFHKDSWLKGDGTIS